MKKKGFTLIEMLVVLVIIAIILTIAIPSVTKLKTRLTRKEYDTHVRLMKQALDSYTVKNQVKLKTYSQETSCMIINYSKLTNTELLHEKGVKCEGKVALTSKGNNNYDYRYFLNCYSENDKTKSHPIETYGISEYNTYKANNHCIEIDERESDNAFLRSLAVEGHTLNRTFDKNVTEYETNIGITETGIKVLAELDDATASYKIIGDSNLKPGSDNEVIVRVIAENGTKKEYKIKVNKEMSTSIALNSITSSVCELEYSEEKEAYICLVANEVQVANITAVPPTTGTGVTGTGSYILLVGENEITITVTSEVGLATGEINETTRKEYKVIITREGNNDTTLATLKTDVCEIEYEKNQYEYTCVVDNSVTKIEVEATPTLETSEVEVTGTNLGVGTNNVIVKVKAEDGTEKEYVIKVTRRPNANAKLRSLAVSNCVLTPAFDKDVTEYTCRDVIGNGVDEVEVTAEKETTTGRVEGTGTKTLGVGRNVIEVKVIAEDETTTETYKVTLLRNANSNAHLRSLSVDGYTLNPVFNKDTLEYNVTVENNVTSLGLHYDTENSKAEATVTGNSNFEVGENIVKIKVLAEDNMTEMNYIIKVHKKSNDATLKNLGVTGYTINPTYTPATLNYGITVENNVTEVNILTEKNHEKQTVTVTGNTDLIVGDNNVLIKVKAEDGTERTYKVVVHKKSNDATLKNLGVTGYTISPVFNAGTTEYGITVENNVTSILVTHEKNHSGQTVTIEGNTGLIVGNNNVLIKVKAEDGTEKIYKIVVHKKSNDATLRSLRVLGYTISPEYSASTTTYTLSVENNVEEVEVEYEKNHESQTTILAGNTGFKVGDNNITVKVKAEDGTEKTYKIVVRRKSNDATLKSLSVEGYTMTPTFEKEEINYKVTVGYATTQLPLHYEKENESAEVTVTGNTLQVGDNEVLVKVKAEDGTEKTYKIDAYRKNNEARLSSLTVPGCTISPEFNKDQLTYACEVGYNVSTMTLEGETEDAKATITSIPTNQTINFGSNELKVKVSAEDSNYTKEYKITVTKNKDTRNKLLYLGIEGFLILTPEGEYFSSNEFEYVANTEATRLKIVGEADSDVSTILGLDEFDIGWGTVEKVITVTSQSGLPSQYRITIHNNRPTAPVLQATATDWSGEDVIVSIYEDGSAETGIKEYEYYVTQSNQAPTDATVATGVLAYDSEEETTETLTISENGVWNVYYRLVSNYENKSPWSAKQVVKVDKIKPVAPTGEVTSGTKKNSSSEYYTSSSVGLTVTNGSDTLSGYKKNTYTLSGATTKAETEIGNGEAITVSNEGITTVTLYGYDNVDNKSEGRTYTIKIDRTPPVTGTATVTSGTKTVSTSDYYTSNNVVLTVADGSDALSGYWKTKYTLSGATVQSTKTDLNGTKTITITNEGETTVTLYGYDNAGNEGAARTYTIKIDRTVPPEGTITVTGTTGNNGWYKSNPTVKFTQSTDALSGTNRITYKLEGAKTANETTIGNNGTITIDKEGITTVTLYVYDNAGNRSAKTVNVKVDTVAPGKPTVEITGGTKGYDNWYKDNVTVKVTGSDGTSDVEKVTYVLTGSTTKSETDLTNGGTFTVSNNGTTTVTAYTIDKAGNKSEGATLVVKKDTTGPSKTEKQTVTRETNKLTVGYNAVSATSGIYEYKCYYGTSNNPSTLGTVSGNNCVFSGLTADTLYYFKRCAISNSNVEVCSDVSSERTRHNFYTITVVNGKFSDGTTTKSIEATESVTVTANSLSTNGWVEATTGTQEYREYYWDIGNSKTITVTKNETITFTQLYNVTKYKYKISFSGYSSLDRWTNDNGDKKFTFPAAQTNEGYIFKGWSTTNGATSGSAASSTGTATGPTTYYAAWIEDSGLFDAVGTQLYTWQQLIDNDWIAVNSNGGVYFKDGMHTRVGKLKVTRDPSVKGISNLYGATGIFAVELGNNITYFDYYAFEGCTGLETINIPSSMETINGSAFRNCTNLKTVSMASGVKVIKYSAFQGCTKLANITIPNTVTTIESNAFEDCEALTSINIPNSVTSLGYRAFYGCSGATSITMGTGLTSLTGNSIFEGCSSVTSLTIGPNVTALGENTFKNCTSLKKVVIPDKVTQLRSGYNPFYGDPLEEVTIGSGVTSIDSNTFSSFTNLTKVTFKDTTYWEDRVNIFSSSDLANTSTAATYLKSTYKANNWYKHDNPVYKVTVVNGSVSNSIVESGTSVTATADNSKLPANGWVETSTGTQEYREYYWVGGNTKTQTITSNTTITFTSSYNVTKYKYLISFSGYSSLNRWTDDNGNKTFTFPGAQSQTGYTFNGWSTTNGATTGTAAGASGTATGPTIYYAAWQANTYTVTLDQQSGSGGSSSVTATYNSAMPSATMPKRAGYNFYGYYTSTSGSGTQYYTAGMQSARSYTLTSGTILYAYWQTAPTISTGTTTSPSLVAGQWYYYKFTPSTSGYYEFKSTASSDTYGYLYDASGNQITSNDDGGDNTNFLINYQLTAGTTYYYAIRWYSTSTTGQIPLSLTKQVYTVTLDQQSGSGGSSSVSVGYGEAMPSATKPTRIGYNFYGYYTSTGGGGTQYYTAGMKSARNYDKTTGTILYAYWGAASVINAGNSATTNIVAGQWYYYKFTPSSSGSYVFKSTLSSGDTYGYLYNSSGTQLTYDDDSGDGNNFSITYTLTAGTTYYYAVRWYSDSSSGNISVSLTSAKKANGSSCSSGSECVSGYCVSSLCANSVGASTISLSGTSGSNGWYRSAVTATVTNSSASSLKYALSGAQTASATAISSGGTISITAQGTTTITVYAYNVNGTLVQTNTSTVKIDTVAPTPGVLAGSSINATCSTDATSGNATSSTDYNYGQTSFTTLSPAISYASSAYCMHIYCNDNAGNSGYLGCVDFTNKLPLSSTNNNVFTYSDSRTINLKKVSSVSWYQTGISITLSAGSYVFTHSNINYGRFHLSKQSGCNLTDFNNNMVASQNEKFTLTSSTTLYLCFCSDANFSAGTAQNGVSMNVLYLK